MAKVRGSGLNFTARLNTEEAIKKAREFKAEMKRTLADLNISSPKIAGAAFDTKPLTEYQKKQLEIKQQVIDMAKAKQDADRADKQAALDRIQALRDERLAREKINTEIAKNRLAQQEAKVPAKRVTQISNSQAEIDAYNQAQKGSMLYTSAINAQIVAKARLNAETARQAAASGSLTPVINTSVAATQQQTIATNAVTLSKKQLAQMLAEEKYRQQQSTAELKNNAREMLNAKGSLEQRRAALIRLTTAYDRLSVAERKTAWGTRMKDIIKGVSDQVRQLEFDTNRYGRNVGNYGASIGAFFDSIKQNILTTMGPIALVTAAWTAAKAAFHNNVEISDNFVDVQRTAKLSAEGVDKLGEQLKKLNTRTSLEGLLDIGFIGGRLGVAQEDMVGFIKTVDQLAVVLKKEFPGGAEAVTTALGKIIAVYKIAQREGITLEQALKNTGSTFLELAHSGQVNVQYLQDFALRTAGVAQVAKISLPTMLAYGAVLSQAGITAQVAGSSVTRLISSLSTKRDKFFAIAQLADSTLTIEKFTNLINTDTKSALELFFKGLKSGNPTQTEFSDRIKTLAFTTGAAKNAVIALAENQDLLFEKTKIANKANEEGTSVAHNFELANNSLAASFDKISNSISNAFTNSSASRKLAELLNSLTDNRTEAERISQEWLNNKHRVEELESELKPLVSRYDQLKKSGKLSTDQQEELRKITAKIGELLPGVTTKFDNFGNSLEISRGRVQDLTKAQKELLELQNRDALKAANEQFDEATKRLPNLRNELEAEFKPGKGIIGGLNQLSDELGKFFFVNDAKGSRVQGFKDNITKLSSSQYEAAKAVRALGGELTKSQQAIIDYYEVLNKPKVIKKKPATITGDGTSEDLEGETMRTTDVIKAEIKGLEDANKKLAITSDQFKANVVKIKALRRELKTALNGGIDTEGEREANRYNSALKSRNDLQKSIDDLVKKGTDKQLSADEQELESTKKLYADKLAEAAEYNKTQAKLDEENRKKGLKVKGLRVDGSGIMRAGANAEAAVRDKQDTEKLKIVLDKQKQLYADYEAYKYEVGEENARARFKDELDTNVTYLEALKAKRDEILNGDGKAKGGADVDTAGNRLKLKLLDEEIAAEIAANKKKNDDIYADAYRAAMTNAQALLAIENDYQRQVKALGAGATQEQIDNLKRQRDERVRSENEANAYISSGHADLLEKLDSMTRSQAIEALNMEKARWLKQYQDKLISARYYSEQIASINNEIDNLTGNNIFNRISNAISEYKEAKKAFEKSGSKDDAVGVINARTKMYNSISDGAEAAAVGMSGLADIFDQLNIGGEKLQDTLKGVSGILQGAATLSKGIASGNPVDIVSGSVNILSSAISLFNTKDKNLQKKIDGYQRQLNELGRAYKQLDRAVQNSVGESYYTDSARQIENLQQQQAKLTQMRDAEVDKKKSDQAKIDEYNNQIADIPNQIADIQKAISENLIQTNFKELSNNLADAFAEAFAAGEDAAEEFDDVFNKVIANAIKNSLKLKILDPIVKKFTDDLTAYALANNNSIIGFDFDSYKKQLENAGKLFQDALKGSEEFFQGVDDSGSALNKGIKGITQETASALEGIERGQYDQQKRTVVLLTQSNDTIGKIYNIGLQKLNALEEIRTNTANTVTELKTAVTELKAINKNTKSSPGSLRGAGLG